MSADPSRSVTPDDRGSNRTELRESDKRFREAFAYAPVGMVIVDLQGHYLHVNSAYCQITGYSEEELLSGRITFQAITHPADLPFNQKEYDRMIAGEIPAFFLEKRYIRKDGSLLWVRVSTTLYPDEHGSPFQLIGLVEDIDARKRAENALREREQRYHTLYVSIDQGYTLCEIVHDQSGRAVDYRLLEMNPAFEKMTGIPMESALGRTGRELVPGLEEFWIEAFGKVVQTGEPVHFEGYCTPMSRWFDTFASSIGNGRLVILFSDITERKRAERSLQEANQRKDEFLAMLAHELRNPLAAIRNAANVARMSADEDDRRWAEEVMERQVGSLSRIVDDLLDVSRITSGKIQLHREQVDVAAILDYAVETVDALVEKRQHELITMYDREGGILLDADPIRLEQIVVNLLTNAVKYTEPGGADLAGGKAGGCGGGHPGARHGDWNPAGQALLDV